jgi:hypothetical protein
MRINTGREFTNVLMRALEATWPEFVQRNGTEISQNFIGRVRDVIDKQEQSWPPLNPAYLARKIRRGRDPRMLVSSKQYMNNFEAVRVDAEHWKMGPKHNRHPEAHLTFEQLGMVHEYGAPSRNIPPRPHWGPVFKEFQDRKVETETKMLSSLVSEVHNRILKDVG